MSSKPVIVEQSFPVQPEAVWRAVTDPHLMRQWYFEPIEDFRAEVGFETQFDIDTGNRVFRHLWKVTDVVPGTSITYTWRYDGFDGCGVTTWKIEETDEGARLILTCTGIDSFPRDIPEFTRESCLAGWEYFIQQSLPDFLSRT